MQRFCPDCGTSVEGHRFCSGCGTPVAGGASEPAGPSAEVAPVADPYGPPPTTPPVAPEDTSQVAGGRRRGPLVLVGMVLLAVVATTVAVVTGGGGSSSTEARLVRDLDGPVETTWRFGPRDVADQVGLTLTPEQARERGIDSLDELLAHDGFPEATVVGDVAAVTMPTPFGLDPVAPRAVGLEIATGQSRWVSDPLLDVRPDDHFAWVDCVALRAQPVCLAGAGHQTPGTEGIEGRDLRTRLVSLDPSDGQETAAQDLSTDASVVAITSDDEALYLVSEELRTGRYELARYTAADAAPSWTAVLRGEPGFSAAVTARGGIIGVAVSSGERAVFDAVTGEASPWRNDARDGGPTRVHRVTDDGLYEVVTDRRDGELIEERTARVTLDGDTVWSTEGQLVDLGARAPRGVALVSRGEDRLVALDVTTGEERWSAVGQLQPRWAAGDVLLVTEQANVRALDLEDGSTRWSVFVPGDRDLVASVVPGPAQVYVAEDGRVEALDLRTGERRWDLDLGDGFATLLPLGDRLVARASGTYIGLDTRR